MLTKIVYGCIILIEMWSTETVATLIQLTINEILSHNLVSLSVAADGSLFLFAGFDEYVDRQQKSNNTAYTTNNSQSVHVSASFRDIFPA